MEKVQACRKRMGIKSEGKRGGIQVAYEILKSIVEAEAQAAEKKQKAAEEVQKQKADAQAKADAMLEETEIAGRKAVESAVEEAVEDSVTTIQGIRREAEEACQEIRKQAAGKREEAIQAIIGKVVGTYGSN